MSAAIGGFCLGMAFGLMVAFSAHMLAKWEQAE